MTAPPSPELDTPSDEPDPTPAKRRRWPLVVAIGAAVLVLGGAGVTLAVIGSGDELTPAQVKAKHDAAYIDRLKEHGIGIASTKSALAVADEICTRLDDHEPPLTIGFDIVSRANGALTAEQAGFVIGASVSTYCPEHEGDLKEAGQPFE